MMVAMMMLTLLGPTAPATVTPFDALDSCFVIEAGSSLGTGFLVEEHTVVTAAHVVGSSMVVTLKAANPDVPVLHGRVTHVDVLSDVAIIALDQPALGSALQLQPELPKVGVEVFALGSPIGELVASRGNVVDVIGGLIESSTPVDPGSSGGPLLDGEGRVVGIVIEESVDSGHAMSVPAVVVERVLDQSLQAPVAAQPISPPADSPLPLLVACSALLVGVLALVLALIAILRKGNRPSDRIVITLDKEKQP